MSARDKRLTKLQWEGGGDEREKVVVGSIKMEKDGLLVKSVSN